MRRQCNECNMNSSAEKMSDTYPTDSIGKIHMTGLEMSRAPAVDWLSIVLFGCHQQSKQNEKSNCVAKKAKKT